ncbi:MAG: DNA-3-methyladenine glycosylase family protein [Thermomicrobiales bacterium]
MSTPPTPERRRSIGATLEFALTGPAGEPVDLRRTLSGHGVTSLPPMFVDERRTSATVTLPVAGAQPREVVVRIGRPGFGAIDVVGDPPSATKATSMLRDVRHLLRLDHDLSPFYALVADHPDIAWCVAGAGRMTRCLSTFEDVVKTICTTNCAWSATVRMATALVRHLGEPAPDAPPESAEGRAFPTPAAMAAADESFYREVVRAGYRGTYLKALAQSIVDGDVDLDAMCGGDGDEAADAELSIRLQTLPGVGPYAAAHIMMMLGRSSFLVLDSWTRPTYAKRLGVEAVADAAITARFAPYGRYAGLAFWVFLTRDWLDGA